jgi:hypothetical protein
VEVLKPFDISYLEEPENEASLLGESINAGWYVSDVYVKAPKGFKISTSLKGTYEKEILYNESIKKLYYRRDSDGATTDGIVFNANAKIDKVIPSIKCKDSVTPVNGGQVFSDGFSFTIYDENLKEVKLDGKPQNVKDGSCIIKMPADRKARNVNVIAYDEAGNKYELKFTMYPAWMKTRTIPAGMDVYLENGIEYNLESEREWTLKDDSTVYSGGAFYVKETNDYNFNVKTK